MNTSGQPTPGTELPQITERRHPTIGRRVVGAAIVAAALSAPNIGCSGQDLVEPHNYELLNDDLELGNGGDIDTMVDNFTYGADEKSHEVNKNPRFRATTVSFYRGNTDSGSQLGGSASLVKRNGSYVLATTEHVVNGLMMGLDKAPEAEDRLPNDTPLSPVELANESQSLHALVPGVAMLRLESSNFVHLEESRLPKTGGTGIERFATIDLTPQEQDIIRAAEDDGKIEVPELSQETPQIGDIVHMPLAESGESIPFFVVGFMNGRIEAYPAILFDEGLDMAAATKSFESFVSEMEEYWSVDRSELDGNNLFSDYHKRYQAFAEKHNKTSDNRIRRNLPCMGDSGSPLLDDSGNVLGTLGLGQPSGEYGTYISRDLNSPENLVFECLYTAEFAVPQSS